MKCEICKKVEVPEGEEICFNCFLKKSTSQRVQLKEPNKKDSVSEMLQQKIRETSARPTQPPLISERPSFPRNFNKLGFLEIPKEIQLDKPMVIQAWGDDFYLIMDQPDRTSYRLVALSQKENIFLFSIPQGDKPQELGSPGQLAFFEEFIFIHDMSNNKILKSDTKGKVDPTFFEKLTASNEIEDVSYLASHSSSSFFYVADAYTGVIMKCTPQGER